MSTPVTLPAYWPKPNYVNPESRKGGAIAYNTVLMVVVVTIVSLRYCSRVGVLKQRLGWDDYFIGLSLLCTLALSIANILGNTVYGYSRHVWDIPPAWYPGALACGTVIKLAFILAATFTRISVLCFYSRLVHNSGVRWFRYALFASHVFVATLGIGFLLPMIFSCRPVSAAFTVMKPQGAKCINEGILFYIGGIINTVADALITVLPIPLIMRLQMPRHEQIGVIVLLSLGFFVTLAGVVRTYYIWLAQVHTQDETWWSYPLFVAASVEVDVGIVCACIPTIRPVFAPYVKSLHTTFSSNANSHNGTNRRRSLGGSQHSTHLDNNYSRNTPSPSKHAFMSTAEPLQSLTTSGASTLHRATPDSMFNSRREDEKQEEFDLTALSQVHSRTSISPSDISTLVPSSAVSPTGSIYIPRRACNALGKDRKDSYGGGIPVIKEVHVESHRIQKTQPASRDRSPFRPFTSPGSPPQAGYRLDSPTSILNEGQGDDWTRLPYVDNSRLTFTEPRQPGYVLDLEKGVTYPEASSNQVKAAEIGVAETCSMEDLFDDADNIKSDRNCMSGGPRAPDEDEELVDVLDMFKESRVQKLAVVRGKARIVNNRASPT